MFLFYRGNSLGDLVTMNINELQSSQCTLVQVAAAAGWIDRESPARSPWLFWDRLKPWFLQPKSPQKNDQKQFKGQKVQKVKGQHKKHRGSVAVVPFSLPSWSKMASVNAAHSTGPVEDWQRAAPKTMADSGQVPCSRAWCGRQKTTW